MTTMFFVAVLGLDASYRVPPPPIATAYKVATVPVKVAAKVVAAPVKVAAAPVKVAAKVVTGVVKVGTKVVAAPVKVASKTVKAVQHMKYVDAYKAVKSNQCQMVFITVSAVQSSQPACMVLSEHYANSDGLSVAYLTLKPCDEFPKAGTYLISHDVNVQGSVRLTENVSESVLQPVSAVKSANCDCVDCKCGQQRLLEPSVTPLPALSVPVGTVQLSCPGGNCQPQQFGQVYQAPQFYNQSFGQVYQAPQFYNQSFGVPVGNCPNGICPRR